MINKNYNKSNLYFVILNSKKHVFSRQNTSKMGFFLVCTEVLKKHVKNHHVQKNTIMICEQKKFDNVLNICVNTYIHVYIYFFNNIKNIKKW